MRFADISAVDVVPMHQLQPVAQNCSQFLKESGALPLVKNLPLLQPVVSRVKVRQRSRTDRVSEAFNSAFGQMFTNIRERSVFAYPLVGVQENHEPHYVFPVDGYRYFYSKAIINSSLEYSVTIDTLVENVGDCATDIVADLLKLTYESTNLIDGIRHGSEIIFYEIPAFYAIKASAVRDYHTLAETLGRLNQTT